MCAHTAIVFARYMFLTMETRADQDARTAGPIFCMISEEIAEISIAQAFEKIQLFLTKLMQGFNAPEEEIFTLFASLIADVPEYIAVFLKNQADCSTFLAKSVCEV